MLSLKYPLNLARSRLWFVAQKQQLESQTQQFRAEKELAVSEARAVAERQRDEVDKMTLYDSKEPSFSPKFDLLKPLEGGLLSGEAGRGSSRERFELDCDRCIFILSGAFTGIDEKIALRLATKGNTQAVFDTNSTKVDYSSFNEDELRAQISLEDVEAWGFPRELVGRDTLLRKRISKCLEWNARHRQVSAESVKHQDAKSEQDFIPELRYLERLYEGT